MRAIVQQQTAGYHACAMFGPLRGWGALWLRTKVRGFRNNASLSLENNICVEIYSPASYSLGCVLHVGPDHQFGLNLWVFSPLRTRAQLRIMTPQS